MKTTYKFWSHIDPPEREEISRILDLLGPVGSPNTEFVLNALGYDVEIERTITVKRRDLPRGTCLNMVPWSKEKGDETRS